MSSVNTLTTVVSTHHCQHTLYRIILHTDHKQYAQAAAPTLILTIAQFQCIIKTILPTNLHYMAKSVWIQFLGTE